MHVVRANKKSRNMNAGFTSSIPAFSLFGHAFFSLSLFCRRGLKGGGHAGKRHVRAIGAKADAAARGVARKAFYRGADRLGYALRHADEERKCLVVHHTVDGEGGIKRRISGNVGLGEGLVRQAFVELCNIHTKAPKTKNDSCIKNGKFSNQKAVLSRFSFCYAQADERLLFKGQRRIFSPSKGMMPKPTPILLPAAR